MEHNLDKSLYRSEIDGIRAFAVICVIINHFNKEIFPSGYLGVDIFFVISGYVITSSLSTRKSENFSEFIVSFYERRIKRLIPALICFVLVLGFFIKFFNPYPQEALRTGISSLFGLSNLYLLKLSTNYFAESTSLNPFTHTWSLGVEEQFYFLFPFFIWFSGYGRKTKKSSKNLFLLLLTLTIISFLYFLYLHQTNQPAAYFLMPSRFWEMSSGALLFLVIKRYEYIKNKLDNFSPIYILLSILGVMFLPINYAVSSTISVVILSILLIACLNEKKWEYKLFTYKKITYIGLISYSLYLWHWGVIAISKWTIGIYWWTIPFQFGLILLLANASYKLIENPLRKKQFSLKNWKTIFYGLILLIFSSITLFQLDTKFKDKFYLGKNKYKSNNNWISEMESATNKINGIKCNFSESYSDKKINLLFKDCNIKNKVKNHKNRTIAFLGDSFTLSLMNSQKIIFEDGNNIIHYSGSSCPFPNTKYGLIFRECTKFLVKSEKVILESLKRGDYIIIYNYLINYLGDDSLKNVENIYYDQNENIIKNGEKKLKLYKSSLKKFAKKADKKGIKIIFIGAGIRNPSFKTSAPEWFRPINSNKIYAEERINSLKLNKFFEEGLKEVSNVIVLDPLNTLECCENYETYNLYYRDGSHLNDYGANKIMKKLLTIINRE